MKQRHLQAPWKALATVCGALIGISGAAAAAESAAKAASRHKPKVAWDKGKPLRVDVNCDGRTDVALVGSSREGAQIAVFTRNLRTPPSVIFFPWQMLCSRRLHLSADRQDLSRAQFLQTIGATPEGFKPSKVCRGIQLHHGDCDAMHIYWNHKRGELYFWRS